MDHLRKNRCEINSEKATIKFIKVRLGISFLLEWETKT